MAVCPSGHVSQTSDYCDTCGAVIGGAPISEPSGGFPAAPSGGSAAGPAGAGAPCPSCGAAQEGRFCEECGYDFELAALVPGGGAPAPGSYPPAPPPPPVAAPSPVTTGLTSASGLSGGTTGLSSASGLSGGTTGLTSASGLSGGTTGLTSASSLSGGTTGLSATGAARIASGQSRPITPSGTSGASGGSGATIPGADGETGPGGDTGFDLDAALAAAEAQAQSPYPPQAPPQPQFQPPPPQFQPPPQFEPAPSPDGLEAEMEAESTVIVLGTGTELDLIAVINADPDYYRAQVDRGDIVESEFPFPKYPGERRIALDVGQVRIGRASASRGLSVEIDLTGPPLDPAVSHLHAQLLRQADHTWTLVDMNSANGTRVNGAEDPIPAETEIPVSAGDRIHLGVWTTITLIEA